MSFKTCKYVYFMLINFAYIPAMSSVGHGKKFHQNCRNVMDFKSFFIIAVRIGELQS